EHAIGSSEGPTMGTDGVTPKQARPALAKALALLGLLTLGGWHLGYAQAPASDVVADIVVYGNRTIPTDKILRYVTKVRVGGTFSYANLHDDASKLSQTGLFRRVSADKKTQYDERSGESRLVVYFVVEEYPNTVQDVIYRN